LPAIRSKDDKLQLLYQGSVKRVFACDKQKDRLWFEFSDDYSVFDWGKMPDTIANKGRSLTVLGAHFFHELSDPVFWRQLKQSKELADLNSAWLRERFESAVYAKLCSAGMPSHFARLTNTGGDELSLGAAATSSEALLMEVQRAEVFRPEPVVVLGQPVYQYPAVDDKSIRRLVPLEVVFRFGMPAGSSLKERLDRDPDYARQLGLKHTPEPGKLFDRAVIELFTKLEPKDRLLGISEALNISTLEAEQFNTLTELSMLAALGLRQIFAEKGIELWDGKFEFIFDGRDIVLADSIGPDELRLLYKGLQLSKEMIRQVYRGTEWESSLKKAQKLAADRGTCSWKEICSDELKSQPAPLPSEFKAKIDLLYGVLANHMTGQQLFAQQPSLEAFAQSLMEKK